MLRWRQVQVQGTRVLPHRLASSMPVRLTPCMAKSIATRCCLGCRGTRLATLSNTDLGKWQLQRQRLSYQLPAQ